MSRIIALVAICGLMASQAARAEGVVSTRTLAVGTVLTERDIASQDDESGDQLQAMLGMEVRRTIYSGHPVSEHDLGPQTYVQRNDVVVMTFRSRAIGLRTLGRALGRGGEGEVIDVMNLDSRLTIRAVVTAPGQVEIVR